MIQKRILGLSSIALFGLAVLLQFHVLTASAADHHASPSQSASIDPGTQGSAPANDIETVPSCPFCGMDRQKFGHSRVFVQYEDGSILGTCSLHCAAVDMAVHIDKTPAAIWVGDYRNRQLVRAENAVWVMGGNKNGVMTKRAKWAFDGRQGADEFILSEGGKIVSFEDAIKAAYEDMYEDTKMIRERRKMRRMTQH